MNSLLAVLLFLMVAPPPSPASDFLTADNPLTTAEQAVERVNECATALLLAEFRQGRLVLDETGMGRMLETFLGICAKDPEAHERDGKP